MNDPRGLREYMPSRPPWCEDSEGVISVSPLTPHRSYSVSIGRVGPGS